MLFRRARRFLARTAMAVSLLTALFVARPAPAGATLDGIFVTTCAMTINVSWGPAMSLTVQPEVATFSGSGPCVVSDKIVGTGFINGALGTVPAVGANCVAGPLLGGTAQFGVLGSSFPMPLLDLVATITGPTLNMELAAPLGEAGHAEFAQSPTDVASCLAGGSYGGTTWTGVVVMEDPPLPPV